MLVAAAPDVWRGLIIKPFAEARTSDSALTPDSHLQFETEPNTTYLIRGAFIVHARLDPDFKWTLAHSGTTDAALFGLRKTGTQDVTTGFLTAGSQDFWMLTAAMMAAASPVATMSGAEGQPDHRAVGFFEGVLRTGASGGIFSLTWAQNTSDPDPTTVYGNSWLHRQVLEATDVKIKAADTSRTTTTAAAADPDLQLALGTATDWLIQLLAHGSAGATPDFKIGIDDGGGTPTYFGGLVNIAENAYSLASVPADNEQIMKPVAALTAATTQPMTGSDTANTGNFYHLAAAGRFSSAANPFSLIWAQNTSSGTATAIKKDSWLVGRATTDDDEFVWKTSDETRSSTDTLADDSELAVALVANANYIIDVVALYTSNDTADFKCAIEFTGTVEDFTGIVDRPSSGPLDNAVNGGAEVQAFTGATGAFGTIPLSGNNTANTYGGVRYTGLLQVGASGGVLKFKWAQNTLTASNTVVKAGSYIVAERKY